jgi:hypothetical protein
MEGNRRWLGWIGIALGALALLIALGGRGFGSQIAALGQGGSNAPQSYVQPGPGWRSGPAAPGPNAQPNAGQPGGMQQSGPRAAGPDGRRGVGRPADAGFGLGGWFGFPFRVIGHLLQMALLVLLIVLGVWLIRGRNSSGSLGGRRAEPAQGPPQEPAGEPYTDEPPDGE